MEVRVQATHPRPRSPRWLLRCRLQPVPPLRRPRRPSQKPSTTPGKERSGSTGSNNEAAFADSSAGPRLPLAAPATLGKRGESGAQRGYCVRSAEQYGEHHSIACLRSDIDSADKRFWNRPPDWLWQTRRIRALASTGSTTTPVRRLGFRDQGDPTFGPRVAGSAQDQLGLFAPGACGRAASGSAVVLSGRHGLYETGGDTAGNHLSAFTDVGRRIWSSCVAPCRWRAGFVVATDVHWSRCSASKRSQHTLQRQQPD
ncbi:hypothetical protein L1887_55500 [Cichorium endivia]|nr:hypothetical protein L1887_55500 [Cichorium endivia]